MYLGSWKIDDYLTFPANTHTPSTGAATDDDAVPAFRIYEDETGTAIATGSMAKLDDTNTTGFYSERIQLLAATGFEAGKTYTIYIESTVGTIIGTLSHSFQILAEPALHADWINGGRLDLLLDSIIATQALMAGAGFLTGNDSLNAIRTRGDIAWITGGGGGVADILHIQALIPSSIDLSDTATVRFALGLTNAVDDLPTISEIAPGTISIDRKAAGATSWTNILNNVACSEADGTVFYDEVFDSGSGYAVGDSIRVTFKNQVVTASANDFVITGATGWTFQTAIREDMRGTDSGVPLTSFDADMAAIKGAGFVTGDDSLEAQTANAAALAALLDLIAGAGFVSVDDSLEAQSALINLMAGAGFVTGTDSLEAIRDRGDAAWTTGVVSGSGAIQWTYTLTSSVGGSPIADADVWVTSDLAGVNVVASGKTDTFGKVTFYLDAGTHYIWSQKSGWNFDNPDTETVS